MMERYCFFLLFFFSKEDLINHSIQYVQRGAISRWYYSFFFSFFLFQKSRAMEDLYQCIISYFSLVELMISLYSFVLLFFSFFFPFFLFFFVSRNAIFFLFFHSFLCIRARFNKQYALPLFSIQRFSTD